MPKGIQTREGQNCYDRAGRDLIIATFQQKSGYHLITRQAGKQKLVPSTNPTPLLLIYIPTTYTSLVYSMQEISAHSHTKLYVGGLISETFSIWQKFPNIGTKLQSLVFSF